MNCVYSLFLQISLPYLMQANVNLIKEEHTKHTSLYIVYNVYYMFAALF